VLAFNYVIQTEYKDMHGDLPYQEVRSDNRSRGAPNSACPGKHWWSRMWPGADPGYRGAVVDVASVRAWLEEKTHEIAGRSFVTAGP